MASRSGPMHPVGGGLQEEHDLVLVGDEESDKDDEDDGDGVIDCNRVNKLNQGVAKRRRTEVLFRQHLVLAKYGLVVDHGLLFECLDLAGCRTGCPVDCTGIADEGIVKVGKGAGGAHVDGGREGRESSFK